MTDEEREERHLRNKIRIFEDMLLRARYDANQVERIGKEIVRMRIQLQRMEYERYEKGL